MMPIKITKSNTEFQVIYAGDIFSAETSDIYRAYVYTALRAFRNRPKMTVLQSKRYRNYLEKWVAIGKMGHPQKNMPILKLKKSTFVKWITLGKVGHPWKIGH